MIPHNSVFNWSGGKDSSLALQTILKDERYKITQLLTSVNSIHDRISMHGVRRSLLEQQAKSIGLPLNILSLPEQPGMSEYNDLMAEKMTALRKEGNTHSIFGDIFLEDLRKYREYQLKKAGFEAVFPIWNRDTTELIHEFIEQGFKTVTVCVKGDLLDKSFVGRVIDKQFIKDLPENVDPCGENGEFHTFTFDGPIYNHPIPFEIGEKVFRAYEAPKDEKDICGISNEKNPDKMGFWFCDLIPTV